MPDPNQLQYLIKLLDDDSRTVQETVIKELRSFGPDLQRQLQKQQIELEPSAAHVIEKLLDDDNRIWILETWSSWLSIPNDKDKLEIALNILAQFQYRRTHAVSLTRLLDLITKQFNIYFPNGDEMDLCHFLFQAYKIRGATKDYYNPFNSNLIYVINEQRGLPISLACVFILIGYRLGFDIQGCNFPGHFLTIVSLENEKILIDCFDGGRILKDGDLRNPDPEHPLGFADILKLECDAVSIINRILMNLIHAYQEYGQEYHAHLMAQLLEMMRDE